MNKMNEGWVMKSLGEIAEIKGGKRVPKGYHLEKEPTNYPYIRVTDFNDNGSVDLNDIHYISEDVFKQIKNYTITTNDLYISIAGTIGKTGIIPKELEGANLTENACKLVFRNNINTQFVYYFTKTNDFLKQAGLNTRVSAMPKLALTRLSSIKLHLPKSLPEQQRIVTILDEAFAAIDKAKANAEQNLKNAKELFESYLQKVFSEKGEGVKLSSLATDIVDGDHLPPPKAQEGIPFITISDINKKNNKIDFSDTFKVSNEYFQKLKSNRKPKKGDVLYTVTGSYGIPVLIEDDFHFCFQRHIGLIRPNENIISKWLYYWILSPQAFRQANETATGTAQKTVSLTALRNFIIPKIPLPEQRTIVSQLDALSTETKRLEKIYAQKIADLAELKKSVLAKAFSGEL